MKASLIWQSVVDTTALFKLAATGVGCWAEGRFQRGSVVNVDLAAALVMATGRTVKVWPTSLAMSSIPWIFPLELPTPLAYKVIAVAAQHLVLIVSEAPKCAGDGLRRYRPALGLECVDGSVKEPYGPGLDCLGLSRPVPVVDPAEPLTRRRASVALWLDVPVGALGLGERRIKHGVRARVGVRHRECLGRLTTSACQRRPAARTILLPASDSRLLRLFKTLLAHDVTAEENHAGGRVPRWPAERGDVEGLEADRALRLHALTGWLACWVLQDGVLDVGPVML